MATVPAEIDKWNWGAFLLNWIWGIGNNTLIALLMFVPLVNMVMAFILGAKGSAWAWRNKRWESVEHFKATQRKWARWAVAIYIAFVLLFVGVFFTILASFKSSEAFTLAVATLEASEQAAEILGTPMTTGTPMGKVDVSGPTGSAKLSFDVAGPEGKGTVHVEAVKDLGQWKIERMALEQEGTGRRVDITQ